MSFTDNFSEGSSEGVVGLNKPIERTEGFFLFFARIKIKKLYKKFYLSDMSFFGFRHIAQTQRRLFDDCLFLKICGIIISWLTAQRRRGQTAHETKKPSLRLVSVKEHNRYSGGFLFCTIKWE